MTKKATIRSTPQRLVKKSRKKATICSTPDRSMKKSRRKATICSTPGDSTKKSMKKPTRKKAMEKAPISSPPAKKLTNARPPPTRYLFIPRTSGSDGAKLRRCRYCKRSFLDADLPQHMRCCYRAILDKEDVESIEDEDDGKVGWLLGGKSESTATFYAKKAIAHLNSLHEGCIKYKIVRPGPFAAEVITLGPIVHFNFKAKAVGSDLIETFFCQLRMPKSGDVFDVFQSLGPSNTLAPWGKANLQDCTYCEYWVHHPPNLENKECQHLLRGLDEDDVKWIYGPDSDHSGTLPS